MRLYKNVDIADLKSIFSKGILPISKLGYTNWQDNKRANNAEDKVYLFSPLSERNSFIQYGIALLEIEIDGAVKSEVQKNDGNKGLYEEYIVDDVKPSQIKKVYIPEFLKSRIDIDFVKDIDISYCGFVADVNYAEKSSHLWYEGKTNDDILSRFAKTASVLSATSFNFFRGVTEWHTMIDLYNISYLL